MRERCRTEIVELHEFFTAWFTGALDPGDVAFARCASALAPEFTLISPRGVVDSRDSILASVRAAHATRAPEFAIWIDNPTFRELADGLWLATYEEWQRVGDAETARLATAVFRARDGAPNDVEWLHVHETWMPGRAGA